MKRLLYILFFVLLACHSGAAGDGLFVNVRELGAKGDGVADDTRAIQAVLDSRREEGGIIYFPKGTYRLASLLFNADQYGIASALHVYSGQTLLFEKGAVLLRGAKEVSHMIYTHNSEDAGGYDGCSDIRIIGGTIDENSSLGTNDTALNLTHGRGILVLGCSFRGASGSWHSIEVNACRDVLISNCTFEDNSNSEDIQIDAAIGHGNLGSNDGTVCADVTISGCTFRINGHTAIGSHNDLAHHDIHIVENVYEGSPGKNGFIYFMPKAYNIYY